jgi:hypothetical protein
MALEAPISKARKSNLKIYTGFCLVFAVVFAYDGYLSKYEWSRRRSFYEEHVIDGKADDKMIFNQVAPFFLAAGAVGFVVRLRTIRDKKLTADENELLINGAEKIPYESLQKIDKTHFESKGFFVLTYKDEQGREVDRKLSDRNYDNLLVAKIS